MPFKLTKSQLRKKMEMEAMKEPEIGHAFHCFGKLPAELRIKIWKEAAVGTPRVVKLRLNKDVGLRFPGWCSQAQVPAILHTSKEARDEALKVYKKFFPVMQSGQIKNRAGVYFNPCIDTLYIDLKSFQTSRGAWTPDPQALAEVQHLAVQTIVWTYYQDTRYAYNNGDRFSMDKISSYQNLKTLTLVRDSSTLDVHKRHLATTPLKLRQNLTDEAKVLKTVRKELEDMNKIDEEVRQNTPLGAPVPAFRNTPAVRVMEYDEAGVVYNNGMKGYDHEKKWAGYARGKFVRLGRGWQWVIPEQWAEEEKLAEERKEALEVAEQWR